METKEAEQILDDVTYKPNFSIRHQRDAMMDGLIIRVRYRTPDANDPHKTTTVGTQRVLPYHDIDWMHEQALLEWLYHLLVELETHEVQEWLIHNGKRVIEPHPDEPTVPKMLEDYADDDVSITYAMQKELYGTVSLPTHRYRP